MCVNVILILEFSHHFRKWCKKYHNKLFVETQQILLICSKMSSARKLFDITVGTFSYITYFVLQKNARRNSPEKLRFHFVFIRRRIAYTFQYFLECITNDIPAFPRCCIPRMINALISIKTKILAAYYVRPISWLFAAGFLLPKERPRHYSGDFHRTIRSLSYVTKASRSALKHRRTPYQTFSVFCYIHPPPLLFTPGEMTRTLSKKIPHTVYFFLSCAMRISFHFTTRTIVPHYLCVSLSTILPRIHAFSLETSSIRACSSNRNFQRN